MIILIHMQPDNAQSTLTLPQKNNIKDKMAVTFMHALNSRVNYALETSNRDMDGLGIDMTVISQTLGTDRTIASGANEIKFQLKGVSESSSSMFHEYDEYITYRLSKDLVRIGQNMYLIVVVLPPEVEIDDWRTINDTNVLMRARAFYFKIEERVTRGRIQIPKSQQLNHDSYIQLFEQLSSEVMA
jgi:hypothetical protein